MNKDAWDIAVDVAQMLSATGTCGAVIVSLWLAGQGRRPKARVVLDIHKSFYESATPANGRLVITNTGDRNAVVIDARWRLGRADPSCQLVYGHYDDDQDKAPLTWHEVRPGVPNAFTIPYEHNLRNIRKMVNAQGTIPVSSIRRLSLEIEFSTGHTVRRKMPAHVAAELSRYSELESRQI